MQHPDQRSDCGCDQKAEQELFPRAHSPNIQFVKLSILLVVLGREQDFLQGAQVRLSSFQSYRAAGALLALMALLSGGAAKRESITFDEIAHTGAGVSYWQKLDLRLNEEDPPLSKLIAGLPLALRGVHADYSIFHGPSAAVS